MLAVLVDVQVTPGSDGDFITSSLDNATNSIMESGVSRFDVIQSDSDADNFVLVEVYNNDDAPAAHKDTEHYLAWRDGVADIMARPRQAAKYRTIFPEKESAWDVLNALEVNGENAGGDALLCVHVYVRVKEGTEDAFIAATLENARNSVQEAGISRFDVLQAEDDSTRFLLNEVYKNSDAPAAHKETQHYLTWRDTVADMMAEPRSAKKYTSIFPPDTSGWDTVVA
uniref:ABM domain-containing protein n=1 Tax=Prasinoderma coloniale TaxID=156133 RepID=A0A7R9XXG0_9VIRI|eukprot:PRCOL_00002506-RA